jgi:hypothetical protein
MNIKHLITCILASISVISATYGQVSWDVTPTGESMTVSIPANTFLKVSTNSNYELGFFVRRNGTIFCAGKGTYNYNESSEITIYEESTGIFGYEEGEELLLYGRSVPGGCTFRMDALYESNNPYIPGVSTFESGRTYAITGVQTNWYWILTPPDTMCQNDPNHFKTAAPYWDIHFSTPSAGLSLDPDKGTIDPSASGPGTYRMNYSSEYCLINYSDSITILEFPEEKIINKKVELCEEEEYRVVETEDALTRTPQFLNPTFTLDEAGIYTYEVKHASGCFSYDTISIEKSDIDLTNAAVDIVDETCDQLGTLMIDPQTVSSAYGFQFFTTQEHQSTDFSISVDQGTYDHIAVKDKLGCFDTIQGPFSVHYFEDCTEDLVLYPEENSNSSKITFDEAKHIEVLSKDGTSVYSAEGPVTWKGHDNSGNLLPTGLYFLKVGNDIKTLTIIR